ncbi:MAG: S41 family peptidase [Candidatus Colwellbacteria bacterium]|nr:S41 family peptidase [Candidatus Colwellbacteria bacterium]
MLKRINKGIWLFFIVLALTILVARFTFNLGYEAGTENPKDVVISGIKGGETPEDIDADFSIFWEAWNELREHHVDRGDVSAEDLIYGAISGLAGAYNDPYTIFLKPSDAEKFSEDVRGIFGGVGMEIGIRDKRLQIIAPLKGTPADKAGLKAGDIILEIDKESTVDLSVEESVRLIRGEPGTSITLTIIRDGWDRSQEFTVVRDLIRVPTIEYTEVGDGIYHVQIFSFNENTNRLLGEAMRNIYKNGATGAVLDLRNNPGGFLEVSIASAGWFLEPESLVVKEQFADGKETEFKSRRNGEFKDFPVTILINKGSASASEIFAGALRDNRGIKIIGEKSFGKGTVQELDYLHDGSTLKITIARWVTPKGTVINGHGIEPDYAVEPPEDLESVEDPQLDKAVEILKQSL